MKEHLVPLRFDSITNAQAELLKANQYIEECAQQSVSLDDDADEVEVCRALQLLLQYRLDMQSIFYDLTKIELSLLQQLGIESLQTPEEKKERLSFALGSDDLQHILSLLNRLADLLIRVINNKRAKQSFGQRSKFEMTKKAKQSELLLKMSAKQRSCLDRVKEFRISYEALGKELNYNYISVLLGAIYKFFQVLQYGLVRARTLYQQLQRKVDFEIHLAETVYKAEQVLDSLTHEALQSRLFTPTHTHTMPHLEERAAAKRLGNFFNRSI
jgi:hypothetical protein